MAADARPEAASITVIKRVAKPKECMVTLRGMSLRSGFRRLWTVDRMHERGRA